VERRPADAGGRRGRRRTRGGQAPTAAYRLLGRRGASAVSVDWPDWARAATDPARTFARPEALDDLLVIDCSQASFAGLVASSFLAELGAEVIRVEPPGGDPARHFTPFGLTRAETGLGYL